MTLYSKNHITYISYSTIILCKLYQASCTPLFLEIMSHAIHVCLPSLISHSSRWNGTRYA